MFPATVISGGQTGADRAALDVALLHGLSVGGWVPLGRRAEDGVIPPEYPNLRETRSADPARRTELNVREADGTLLLSHGPLRGGSLLTEHLARRHDRPVLHVDLDRTSRADAVGTIIEWLERHTIEVLNVAGPRASEDPRIDEATRSVLDSVLSRRFRDGGE